MGNKTSFVRIDQVDKKKWDQWKIEVDWVSGKYTFKKNGKKISKREAKRYFNAEGTVDQ